MKQIECVNREKGNTCDCIQCCPRHFYPGATAVASHTCTPVSLLSKTTFLFSAPASENSFRHRESDSFFLIFTISGYQPTMPIFAPFFMQVHYDLHQLPSFTKAVVTIGTFDGVHRGHRQIIDQLRKEAMTIGGETVIITFDPHPRKIVKTQQPAIHLINTLPEKISLLEALGIDHLVVIPFTQAFASQPAEDYIRHFLVGRFHPHTIIIGYDHRFGKNRAGDYRLLEEMAPAFGYHLKEISQQVLHAITISSTRIREALLQSDLQTANALLGYSFFFSGEVVHGDKLGRKLGYPTANIAIREEEKIIPGNGIYAVYVTVDGEKKKGMMSIGLRPTVGGSKRVIEVNIFDFDKEIYGLPITVSMEHYLRAEIKFEGLDPLVQQMGADKQNSLQLLQ